MYAQNVMHLNFTNLVGSLADQITQNDFEKMDDVCIMLGLLATRKTVNSLMNLINEFDSVYLLIADIELECYT